MRFILPCFAALVSLASCSSQKTSDWTENELLFRESCLSLAQKDHQNAWAAASTLRDSISAFAAQPDEATLAETRKAWRSAHASWMRLHAHGGPDFLPCQDAQGQVPANRIAAEPVSESFLEGEQGLLTTDAVVKINRDSLRKAHRLYAPDEVSTGFHAIEFLLWGTDHDLDHPGTRAAADFVGESLAASRRRAALIIASRLLVEDLTLCAHQWSAFQADNENTRLRRLSRKEFLGDRLDTLAATCDQLAVHYLERPFGKQAGVNEPSRFSDTGFADLRAGIRGVASVITGRWPEVASDYRQGGFNSLLGGQSDELLKLLRDTELLAAQSTPSYERLAVAPAADAERQRLTKLAADLHQCASLIRDAGKKLAVSTAPVRTLPVPGTLKALDAEKRSRDAAIEAGKMPSHVLGNQTNTQSTY